MNEPPHIRRRIWPWLPTFLEVAESGSIREAAKRMHVTPAAVSRTLRLLQEEVGAPLFNRVGRSLVLNATGAELRDAIRTASSAVDTGLSRALGDPFVGRLAVASLGVLRRHLVIPSLLDLKREHDGLIPDHQNLGPRESLEAMRRGQLDAAFYYEELTGEGVVVERLGELGTSVYCGRGHPLFRARRLTLERVLEHPFSVPQMGDSGRVQDGWPSDVERQIGMRITLLNSNLEVCRSGMLLTVLPDITALDALAARELRRLGVIELPSIQLFSARPAADAASAVGRVLIDKVRARAAELNALVRAHTER